jgi:hypothetical protein
MNNKIIIGVLFILFMCVGFITNEIIDNVKNERIYNGLYIKDANNYSMAIELSKTYDNKGDWVCVNVAYDMSMEDAYDTCVHECSHKSFSEIFAEQCENDELKCLNIMENRQ